MKHLLMAKGLWGFVDGSDVLASDASETAEASFRSRLQKTFSTIVLAINTAQLYLVTSCEEPQQAWDALKRHFERETLANKLFLKKQYFRTEIKEGTSVEQHLKHMKDITDKLKCGNWCAYFRRGSSCDFVRKFAKKFCDPGHRHRS